MEGPQDSTRVAVGPCKAAPVWAPMGAQQAECLCLVGAQNNMGRPIGTIGEPYVFGPAFHTNGAENLDGRP